MNGGTFLLDQRPRFLLVRRIHEREQVADGDRLDAGILELARGAANGVLIERAEHAPGVVAALGNFLGEALRRNGGRLRIEIIEQVAVARLALNFLDRAVALRDQQSDLGAAQLQQRVGGDGGAVSEKTDLRRRGAVGNESRDPLQHTQRGIFWRARDLLDRELPRRRVEQHEIGVGAAHIHAEPVTRAAHLGLPVTIGADIMPAQAEGQATRTRRRIAALPERTSSRRFLNRRS